MDYYEDEISLVDQAVGIISVGLIFVFCAVVLAGFAMLYWWVKKLWHRSVGSKSADLERGLMSQHNSIHQSTPVAATAEFAPPLTLRFFCCIGTQVVGPYGVSILKAMRSEGHINDATMIREEGETTWMSLGSLNL